MGVHSLAYYNEIRRLLDIPATEPIFILRAQDRCSTQTLVEYQNNTFSAGASETFQSNLDQCIEEFEKWQTENSEKVKVPD